MGQYVFFLSAVLHLFHIVLPVYGIGYIPKHVILQNDRESLHKYEEYFDGRKSF